ncbi:MAG: S-methyl-5'-thioadenosine phosphorylase [Jiangellaceae bacterium]
MTTSTPRAEIGVIGGSGFYDLLDDASEVHADTPYGRPSDAITLGRVGDRRIAFLPRHGRDHAFPPHRIPYRANLWALRSLGVRQLVAPCAVGSVSPEIGPGRFVVPDQVVDRTSGRAQTFYDDGAVHVPFADPYCRRGRDLVLAQARAAGLDPVDGATMVVVEGPRFSTRAESRWFADRGWAVVNMTGHPEAVLARELALCYTCVALVTDLDAGVATGETVTQDQVFRVFAENTARMRDLVLDTVAALDLDRRCPCPHALDGIRLPFDLP